MKTPTKVLCPKKTSCVVCAVAAAVDADYVHNNNASKMARFFLCWAVGSERKSAKRPPQAMCAQ